MQSWVESFSDDEGRVVSGNVYYDGLQRMTQLGHMEPAEAAPAR